MTSDIVSPGSSSEAKTSRVGQGLSLFDDLELAGDLSAARSVKFVSELSTCGSTKFFLFLAVDKASSLAATMDIVDVTKLGSTLSVSNSISGSGAL